MGNKQEEMVILVELENCNLRDMVGWIIQLENYNWGLQAF